jgi:hypothetical protein
LANLGSESETCVGSRVHLVGVFISFEKNFYRLPFTPPLSGSPYRSFNSHLLPCRGYLLWRSTGLNTDSWRPLWGHHHDLQANLKDLFFEINLLISIAATTTNRRVGVLLHIIRTKFDGFDSVFTDRSKSPRVCVPAEFSE